MKIKMVHFYINQDYGLVYCHQTIEEEVWLPFQKIYMYSCGITWTTLESFSAAPATVMVPATARMLPSWLHWHPTALIPVSTSTGSNRIKNDKYYNLVPNSLVYAGVSQPFHKRYNWKIFFGNFLRLCILIFFVNYFCLYNKLYIDCYIFWLV